MFLGEADRMLTPFLAHSDFEKFFEGNSRLQELVIQIKPAMQKLNIANAIMPKLVITDEETDKAFREFAEICKDSLS